MGEGKKERAVMYFPRGDRVKIGPSNLLSARHAGTPTRLGSCSQRCQKVYANIGFYSEIFLGWHLICPLGPRVFPLSNRAQVSRAAASLRGYKSIPFCLQSQIGFRAEAAATRNETPAIIRGQRSLGLSCSLEDRF